MKTSVLIILTVTLLIVGALAAMNNACKSGLHAWCAPTSTLRDHKPSRRAWFIDLRPLSALGEGSNTVTTRY